MLLSWISLLHLKLQLSPQSSYSLAKAPTSSLNVNHSCTMNIQLETLKLCNDTLHIHMYIVHILNRSSVAIIEILVPLSSLVTILFVKNYEVMKQDYNQAYTTFSIAPILYLLKIYVHSTLIV